MRIVYFALTLVLISVAHGQEHQLSASEIEALSVSSGEHSLRNSVPDLKIVSNTQRLAASR